MKLKKGDTVIVITGKDKGKKGEITKALPKANKVIVAGVNTYKRHIKKQNQQEGGIIQIERPIDISKLMLIDPSSKKPTRVGYELTKTGEKVRISKQSKSPITTK